MSRKRTAAKEVCSAARPSRRRSTQLATDLLLLVNGLTTDACVGHAPHAAARPGPPSTVGMVLYARHGSPSALQMLCLLDWTATEKDLSLMQHAGRQNKHC